MIELVESCPALWDPKNTGYKKKKSAENWKLSLAEDFNVDCTDTNWTDQELQKNWASFSTYHTSAKNKVKNASGASAEDASYKWKFWEATYRRKGQQLGQASQNEQ